MSKLIDINISDIPEEIEAEVKEKIAYYVETHYKNKLKPTKEAVSSFQTKVDLFRSKNNLNTKYE